MRRGSSISLVYVTGLGKVEVVIMLKEMLSCIRYERLSRWRVVPKINCLNHCQVLVTAADLALQLNETQQAIAWSTNATALKGRYNEAFWDDSAGLYSDNLTTTLHPQDANSLAVVFNLTDSEDQKQRISDGLKENWDSLGPVPPELPDTISPFITGFEVCFIAFCKIGKKNWSSVSSFKPILSLERICGQWIFLNERGGICYTPIFPYRARFWKVSRRTDHWGSLFNIYFGP